MRVAGSSTKGVPMISQVVNIDENSFNQPALYLIPLIGSLFALLIFRKWGSAFRGDNGSVNNFIDILGLLTVASFVGALSATPLFADLTGGLSSSVADLATGLSIGASLLVAIITITTGIVYINNETWPWLTAFGVGVALLLPTTPWLATTVSWWTNNVVSLVWNFFLNIITWIPNQTPLG